jgi:hypothetical protein
MKIEQVRIANRPTYCISRVYVNGEYACDIIEDVDRGLDDSMTEAEIRKRKVYAQTAIPTGTYKITMNVQSPKFSKYKFYYDLCKGYLPRLVKVKGFDGVLWHCGSSAASSAGCAIVGENKVVGKVINSQKTFTRIMKQYFLPAKVLGEEITLTITRKYKV